MNAEKAAVATIPPAVREWQQMEYLYGQVREYCRSKRLVDYPDSTNPETGT